MSDGKVVIDIDGDPRGFEKQINGLGKTVTSGLGGAFSGAAKGLAKTTAAAGAALGAALIAGMGVVVNKGLDRALNIEDAKASLAGLGYAAAEVKTITDSVLGAVRGTAFALDEGMTIAASALAAGVGPGKDLQRYISLIGDAATISKAPLGEIGLIFNKVYAKGKVQAEEMNQLHERGIPILQWLAKSYGVSAEEMSKMVSQGEVDAKRFAAVIEENIGGAALKSGDTVRGAMANVMAAIGRAGEKLVGGFLGPARDMLTGLIDEIDGMVPSFEKTGRGLLSALMGGSSEELTQGLTEITSKLVEGLGKILPVVVNALAAIIVAVATALPALLPPLASAFVDGIMAITDMLPVIIPPFIKAMKQVILVIAAALPEWLPLILEAFVLLVTEIAEALGEMAPTLIPIIYECMIILVAEILKALPKFIEAAFKLIGGLIKGFDNNQGALIGTIKKQAAEVLKSWLDSVPKMLEAGKRLLIGIKDGAVEGFNTRLVPFLKGLGAAALKGLGNLGGVLRGAGIKLLQGLWDGALEKWRQVQRWVSSIAGWIAAHKGPLEKDYKLLQPAGRVIMEGFRKTLGEGFALVLRDLDGYTQQLSVPSPWAPSFAVSGTAQPSSVEVSRVNNFDLHFDKTPERFSDVINGFRHTIEGLL